VLCFKALFKDIPEETDEAAETSNKMAGLKGRYASTFCVQSMLYERLCKLEEMILIYGIPNKTS
jgi:hypothetical protein